jgi:hypothetical protein
MMPLLTAVIITFSFYSELKEIEFRHCRDGDKIPTKRLAVVQRFTLIIWSFAEVVTWWFVAPAEYIITRNYNRER